MSEVLIVSLITGQELIGKVTEMTETFWIERPAAVVVKQGPNGPEVGLANWPILADQNEIKKVGVHVYKSAVVTPPYKPVADLLGPYTQAISGLVVPQKGSLLVG